MSGGNPSSQEGEERPEPALGPMGFGILSGTTALYATYVGVPIAFGGPASMRFLTGPSAFIPIAVYLLAAIVLTVRPRTSGAWSTSSPGLVTLPGWPSGERLSVVRRS